MRYVDMFEANSIKDEHFCTKFKEKWDKFEKFTNKFPNFIGYTILLGPFVLLLAIFYLVAKTEGVVFFGFIIIGVNVWYNQSKKLFFANSEILYLKYEKEFQNEIKLYEKLVNYIVYGNTMGSSLFFDENSEEYKLIERSRSILQKLHFDTYFAVTGYAEHDRLNDYINNL